MSSRRPEPASLSEAVAARASRRSQVHVYNDGFLFSCEGMEAARTERYTATLLFATSEQDIDVELAGRRQQVQIAVLKPFVRKTLHAHGQPFVSVGVNPTHSRYRAFTRLEEPGYISMPRRFFPALDERLQALRAGELGAPQARLLFDQCIEAVTQLLPPLRPMDPRIEHVTALLARDHHQPLDRLAESACLSYYRMSHLFSQEMGLPLRQYLRSLKIHAAARCIGAGMTLTATAHEAGFTDSAHLSRVWTKAFGRPPSHFLNEQRFAIEPRRGAMPLPAAA